MHLSESEALRLLVRKMLLHEDDGSMRQSLTNEPEKFYVVNRRGERVGGPYKSRMRAMMRRDKLDNAYGGYAHDVIREVVDEMSENEYIALMKRVEEFAMSWRDPYIETYPGWRLRRSAHRSDPRDVLETLESQDRDLYDQLVTNDMLQDALGEIENVLNWRYDSDHDADI
jgi:hypothetical protein